MAVSIITCPTCNTLLLSDTVRCPSCKHVFDAERAAAFPDDPLPSQRKSTTVEDTCRNCGKLATRIRAIGWGPDLDNLLCDDCVEDEDESLPVVNSPRMGLCGYCG